MISLIARFCRTTSVLGFFPALRLLIAQFIAGQFSVTPKGYKAPLIVRGKTSDVELVYSIFYLDEYPAKFVRDPTFIIDAGANVGYASVYFAHHFPKAEILAIEPEITNFEMLQKNVRAYRKIRPVHAALWPRSESVGIADSSGEKWAFQCKPGGDISGITMSELLNGHDTIDLFKCDIEGAEKRVFSENAEWLAKVRILMIEIHRGCWKPFFDALSRSKLPFDCRSHGETLIVKFGE